MNSSKMARSERAYFLVAVDRKSLREASVELGVSRETVRKDVADFKAYLAESRRSTPVDERRVVILSVLDDVRRRALEVYNRAVAEGKTLHAIGALNSIVATLAHYRAVEGADMPKEAKVEQDTNVTIRWSDDEADSYNSY